MKYLKYTGGNNDVWDSYFTKESIYKINENRGSFNHIHCDNGDLKISPKEVFEKPLTIELISYFLIIVVKWFLLLLAALSFWAALTGFPYHIGTTLLCILLFYIQSKKIK